MKLPVRLQNGMAIALASRFCSNLWRKERGSEFVQYGEGKKRRVREMMQEGRRLALPSCCSQAVGLRLPGTAVACRYLTAQPPHWPADVPKSARRLSAQCMCNRIRGTAWGSCDVSVWQLSRDLRNMHQFQSQPLGDNVCPGSCK